MVEKNKGFQVGAHIVMIILSLCCIFPFLLLIVSSITDEQELIRNGYTLFPKALSLNAYQYMFKSSNKIISAYGITILSTVVGTVCGLSMTILMAYPLSRRDLPGRNGLAFYVFFAVPMLLNNIMHLNTLLGLNSQITLSALQAGTICLALNCGAYMAEIIRAGIESVDKGQMEAARSLGLSYWKAMAKVVLPQAIKNVLPALANEVVTMVKESSICSVLGMAEIMYTAQTVSGNSYITLAPYVLAALVYFCINYPASKAIEAIERRMRRGDKQ